MNCYLLNKKDNSSMIVSFPDIFEYRDYRFRVLNNSVIKLNKNDEMSKVVWLKFRKAFDQWTKLSDVEKKRYRVE